MPFTERYSVVSPEERNHPVSRVVPDIGAASELDAGTDAPLLHDGGIVAPEIRVVRKDVADPAQAYPAYLPNAGPRSHMEHRTVDPVEMLADILDQQVHAREVRLKRCSEQVRKHSEVEGHCGTV